MEMISDLVHEYAMNHEFLKDFMLAWAYYERPSAKCEVPDLARITALLKSVGFSITKVERMEGEAWAPGMVNGCTVEIQCPVSKTKITLSAPNAMCHCQRTTDSSWSLSWAGATTGIRNLSSSQLKIAIPEELIPGKEMMARICINSLMSIIWPKDDERIFSPFKCERLVKSLDSVYQKEMSAGMEPSRSLQFIGSKGDDSLNCSNASLPSITHDSSGVDSCASSVVSTRSCDSAVGKGNKKAVQNLSLPALKFHSNLPSPKSPYWESSTAKAKRYAEMVKQRESEKKKPK